MSSFRWGMIACPTPTNSQVTVWKLRQPLFSLQIRIVLLTALHSDALLGSAGMPLHFGLSLCNLLEQISPPYPIWKGRYLASIWSKEDAIHQGVAEKWLLAPSNWIPPRTCFCGAMKQETAKMKLALQFASIMKEYPLMILDLPCPHFMQLISCVSPSIYGRKFPVSDARKG